MSDRRLIEAVVQVGADETLYLRCGRGPRVLVVLAQDAAERLRLIERFATEHRVIAPLGVGGFATEVERWLCGVIEGLGLERVPVALAPELAWLATRLVQCVDRVEEVTIVPV